MEKISKSDILKEFTQEISELIDVIKNIPQNKEENNLTQIEKNLWWILEEMKKLNERKSIFSRF